MTFSKSWTKNNGASMLAKILIEDCTELNLYVGKPLTALTRIRDSPLIWGIRQNLVRQLKTAVEKMGKTSYGYVLLGRDTTCEQ